VRRSFCPFGHVLKGDLGFYFFFDFRRKFVKKRIDFISIGVYADTTSKIENHSKISMFSRLQMGDSLKKLRSSLSILDRFDDAKKLSDATFPTKFVVVCSTTHYVL
jgi:hypothetical protein